MQTVSAQGTKLELGAAIAAKTITAATQSNPVKLTSVGHGLSDGAVGKFAGVGGMVQLNGKVGVVRVVDVDNFEIPGIDSTAFSAFTTGGTFTGQKTKVGGMKSYNGFDGQGAEIDTTDFDSLAKEYSIGLQDFGNFGFDVNVRDADEGQMALNSLKAATGIAAAFVLTLRDGKTRTFSAFCKSFSEQGAVDDIVKASVSLRITGEVKKG